MLKNCGFLFVALALSSVGLTSQSKPVICVHAFTMAKDVQLPYDMKILQAQLVAEFKVMLGKDFEIVAEAPATPQGPVYTLDAEFIAWHAGNAAARFVIGFGAGRESSDIQYQLTDGAGKTVLDTKDTIRTNFYSQGSGSTGTLAHPIAQKISDRIKKAKLNK